RGDRGARHGDPRDLLDRRAAGGHRRDRRRAVRGGQRGVARPAGRSGHVHRPGRSQFQGPATRADPPDSRSGAAAFLRPGDRPGRPGTAPGARNGLAAAGSEMSQERPTSTVHLGQFTRETANEIAGELEARGITWWYKEPGWLSQVWEYG